MINKISLKKRFNAHVLIDSDGACAEITDDMYHFLRLKYRNIHYYINKVESCLEIIDYENDEEQVFLSAPNPSPGRLHEMIARMLARRIPKLNYQSTCVLADVATKVTHLELILLPEERP